MKKRAILIMVFILSGLLLNACKTANTIEPVNGTTGGANYFPSGNGTSYKYSVSIIDSAGTFAGSRSTIYSGTSSINGITYQNQIDTLLFPLYKDVTTAHFRKTDNGVYYFLDTTGISKTIPDSLLPYIKFDAMELTALSFPSFQDGASWTVYKMSLAFGPLTIPVTDVSAYYKGKESITLDLSTGKQTKEAVKINYVFKLTVPDLSNPLQQNTRTFSADAWLVENIGFVKWQGNGTVLGAFAGTGIDLADTSTVVTQNLIDFQVK